MAFQIIKRTFEAENFPKESLERRELNKSVVTSEYFHSFPYVLRRPFLMSDGTVHPQIWRDDEYKTRNKAKEDAIIFDYGQEVVFEYSDGKIIEKYLEDFTTWKFFNKEKPLEGRRITMIWSDGNEWDVIWANFEYCPEEGEVTPILWKYLVI